MKLFRKYLFNINIFLLSILSTGMFVNNSGICSDSICPEQQGNCSSKSEEKACCCCSENGDGSCCCSGESDEGGMMKCSCNIENQNSEPEETPVNATPVNNFNYEVLLPVVYSQNNSTDNPEEKANIYKSGINTLSSPPNLYIQNSNFRI